MEQAAALTRQDRLVEACDDRESASDTEELVNEVAGPAIARLEAEFMALQRTRADLDKSLAVNNKGSKHAREQTGRRSAGTARVEDKDGGFTASSRSPPLSAHNNEKVVSEESVESEKELSEFNPVSTHSEACRRSPVTHKEHTKHSGFGVIYKITCMVTRKAYVGQTCWWDQRMRRHRNMIDKCPKLMASVAKHGWDAMKVEVIHECPEEDLDAWEVYFIAKYDTVNTGLNVLPGGGFNPIKDPVVYAKVKAMHEAGVIKPLQLAGYTKEVRAKMSAVHKKRCRTDGGRQSKQGLANLQAGNAHELKNSDAAKAKRASTWEAKREAKLALLPPEEAARVVAQTKRKKTSYAEACAAAGGVEALREKRREWARLRKEKACLRE
jgi:group I intron endonuclease